MIKYTQQSFHKNCKFMFTSIYNRILNYCNSVYKSPSSKTVKKMKEESARWFIDLLQQRYSTGTSDSPCIHTGNKCVIIMVDNTIYNPGLADKLRGILSIYSLCKEKHIDFKINWTYPFELTEYMLPNKINWIIEQEKIKYSLSDSKIVVIDTLPNIHASRQSIIDKKIFDDTVLNSQYLQYHIYTNSLIHTQAFPNLFRELFTPSEKLQSLIDLHHKNIGEKYVAASFRFLELLGDFKDSEGMDEMLPPREQKLLIEQCYIELKKFIDTLPEFYKILVTSDSERFLTKASTLPRTYIIPGKVIHIRYKTTDTSAYMKTFLDMFLLSGAESLVLFKTGKMYNSGFPRLASQIGNKPFKIHEF